MTMEGLNKLALVSLSPTDISLYEYKKTEDAKGVPKWRADCTFDEGDDYQVWLNAITGDVMKITRYPKDWFDKTGDGEYSTENNSTYTQKEIIEAAEKYFETIGISVDDIELPYGYGYEREELILRHDEGNKILKINNYRVDIIFDRKKNETGVLIFLADDLSIQEIFFTNEG